MVEDYIYDLRRNAINEIIEKVNKNPRFLHPTNKERLEYMKRLKFSSGYEFTCWMQQAGIMNNPTNIRRKDMRKSIENAGCMTSKEYLDKCAQKLGFKNCAERVREHSHEIGKNIPIEFREDCGIYFGEFTENLMIQTFEDANKMPYGNPGFDWTCKRGDKIDNKGACLIYKQGHSPFWEFYIGNNSIADWFILSAWDNRDSLNPLHVWAFRKNDLVRGRKFCDFNIFSITDNNQESLKKLEKYEITNRLYKLKELCNNKRE